MTSIKKRGTRGTPLPLQPDEFRCISGFRALRCLKGADLAVASPRARDSHLFRDASFLLSRLAALHFRRWRIMPPR